MKSTFARSFVSLTLTLVLCDMGDGQQSPAASQASEPVMLFQNVRIFDGRGSGTDVLFSQALAQRQGAQLAKLTRWYTVAEALVMATSVNGELLRLSGLRNPYQGKLGIIEEGALADLLLVDGNPLEKFKLIEDPARNFLVIMKGGTIFKNLLQTKS